MGWLEEEGRAGWPRAPFSRRELRQEDSRKHDRVGDLQIKSRGSGVDGFLRGHAMRGE